MECYYQLSGQSLSAKTMMCSPINLKFECDSMINVSTIDQHHPHNAAERGDPLWEHCLEQVYIAMMSGIMFHTCIYS